MKTLTIAFGLMLIAAPVLGQGLNPTGELAMHVVVSDLYLDCPDLGYAGYGEVPPDCAGIVNYASPTELGAGFGYVFVVFCAYNVTGLKGVEYCIVKPYTGRNPVTFTLCPPDPGSLVLGDPMMGGGIQTFAVCKEPVVPCGGLVPFAWANYNGVASPGEWCWCLSEYSYPTTPRNYFIDCSPGLIKDDVISYHCAWIGVPPQETVPFTDCDPGATATDATTWSNVKALYR